MQTRRQTLKLGIASFLAVLASQSSAQNLNGRTVIVIGAGIAGLAAGQALRKSGATVIVFEAGEYVGGRIRTDMSLGAPFEYGAGWIHGPSEDNPIQKLAEHVGGPSFVTNDDNLEVFGSDGKPLAEAEYAYMDETYEHLLRELNMLVLRRDKRSVAKAIADIKLEVLGNPLGQLLLSTFIEFDIGAGIEDISAANAFADKAFDGDDAILLNGYETILAPLTEGLDIHLNTPVNQISYDANGVTVGDLRADYAICTAPLGVLKAKTIQFDPPLPGKLQTAISELGFGSVTKIAMKFKTAFWDKGIQYFGISTEPKGRWNYWLNYRTFSDQNILLGLSFGRYAPIADQMDPSEMTEDALDVLRSVWGDTIGTPEAVLTTHWSEYPNFRGAYSYPQVGGSPDQFEIFAEPIEDRLFFAGEHTIFDYHSTTHGALMSGLRTANAITRR
ncbi:Monoamine oxidase [Phaeobacter gallaeciensis]|uniref:Tryptophan 2-monooxygenase n=1 Tax=Phaeobacter gallaeciensis TaxID=60890 RepID=A0AAC9Z8C3_9RHOB|nr:Monoamine oxidase [Phaeobacter gallaeciensis DSM 26640]ATE92423.1 Monoamine oxidase [Phaeobacter gallaeciensis]ATE97755.1 Monoamine oxidase [Phaeobacter gallaeciensis]ATF01088.1 Monoamine oxidase [Phaeobacter gallaeciensis]ATF05468.1 Monoamine oxidase [Phaeobacter gallaeciensis]